MSDDKPKVGYKNPPHEHRIKKGERRNPNGRPRKPQRAFLPTQTIRDILSITEEERTVRTPRGTKKIATIEALLRRLVQRALEGHGPSLRYVIELHTGAIRQHRDRFEKDFEFIEMVEHSDIAKPPPPENEPFNRNFINDLRKKTRRT
ncbi:DUF5681 domain-containing protein [Roseibium sp.]|uniref:DUF5681 domain-containing protein n=1 Tax=Roseibium sp. TaxID=1936156 RepID=UPI00329A650F